jgi:hypothetical protein
MRQNLHFFEEVGLAPIPRCCGRACFLTAPRILWYARFTAAGAGNDKYHPQWLARSLGFWSGRQGRKSYGVKVPCRQLPDSDDQHIRGTVR